MAILNGIIYNKKDHGLCIYEWDGAIIVRRKSSLTRKRVLTSKEFKKTRDYASKMAIASRLASEIYGNCLS